MEKSAVEKLIEKNTGKNIESTSWNIMLEIRKSEKLNYDLIGVSYTKFVIIILLIVLIHKGLMDRKSFKSF